MTRALVVDDERNMRLMLAELLTGEGYTVLEAADGRAAFDCLDGDVPFELVVLDLRLPDVNGLEILERIRASRPSLPVVVLTAHGTIDAAVGAMRRGAFDFLVKPVDVSRMRELVRRVRGSGELADRARLASPRVDASEDTLPIVGASRGLRDVLATIHKVAATDASVLITGESGTGKELIARALHSNSNRKSGPFVSLNCAALPETLLESELFGFEKGSFTGAHARKLGTFELAQGGTLFLDEIGDMAQALQAKILRALQERRITRIGGDRELEVDVRLISATHRDLAAAIQAGRFRSDLYYRLNVIAVHLPPLRERRDDIPDLARHFAERSARRHGRSFAGFSPDAISALCAHAWPGNIRELENAVEKGLLLGEDAMLASLGPLASPSPSATIAPFVTSSVARRSAATLKDAVASAERQAIVDSLAAARGNKREAARILDVSYKTLFNKLRELGIQTRVEVDVTRPGEAGSSADDA
ncbi:MAG: sigma-54 dependent transcriptional regulator [bacterium]